jgi:V/A-type H+-transporting ATPase subunit I
MNKVYVVVGSHDQQGLLESLRNLAVIHLSPVDPGQAVPDEKCLSNIERLERTIQILSHYVPQGPKPDQPDQPDLSDLSASQVVAETLHIHQNSAELSNQLASLHQQAEKLAIWGDVELKKLERLRRGGVKIKFISVPAQELAAIHAECVQKIAELPGKRIFVAVIDRQEELSLPETAEEIPLPGKDRPTVRNEAARIDKTLKENKIRLAELAHMMPELQRELDELLEASKMTVAVKGGFADNQLFAVQGWVPGETSETLAAQLAEVGIKAAVRILPPAEDENPPTLIKYPAWSRPIKGLFDILGTLPGYRELDLAPFFMVALPVFAAMLIGDAGYGLVFMLPCLLFYRKFTTKIGKIKTHLLITIGFATLVWGILSANYFGVTPDTIAQAGGYMQTVNGQEMPDHAAMQNGTDSWAAIGKTMTALAPVWDSDSDKAREILIKISLLFGCIHIFLAHLRQFFALLPNLRCLAEIGWCFFIWAMLGIIWILFFGVEGLPVPVNAVYGGLVIGFLLFVLFTSPQKNPAKRIGIGFAASLLPMLSTFSDTMSYIRLMAVGMASFYIAAAFNSLAASVAPSATWFAAAPIVLFGHALNIALCVIAIFAHGVRLNMLEFSNNAGIQWAGYAYQPFAHPEYTAPE